MYITVVNIPSLWLSGVCKVTAVDAALRMLQSTCALSATFGHFSVRRPVFAKGACQFSTAPAVALEIARSQSVQSAKVDTPLKLVDPTGGSYYSKYQNSFLPSRPACQLPTLWASQQYNNVSDGIASQRRGGGWATAA